MNRFLRLLEHIKNGTLPYRILWDWRRKSKKKRATQWEMYKTNRDTIVARVQPGVRMRFYLNNDIARLIYCEYFEWEERCFLNAFLRNGDVFVDVGANIGLYAIIAGKCVGRTGSVFAFEPAKSTYRELCKNVALNKLPNVKCMRKALSNAEEIRPLFISLEDLNGFNSFAAPIQGHSFSKENVECIAWDKFAFENSLIGKVTMIKIDIEGWESHFLDGAQKTFIRDDAPVLQIEFTQEAAYSAGSSCKEIYSKLEKFGYHMFRYDASQRKLIPEPFRTNYPYVNLLAIKNTAKINNRLHKNYLLKFFDFY